MLPPSDCRRLFVTANVGHVIKMFVALNLLLLLLLIVTQLSTDIMFNMLRLLSVYYDVFLHRNKKRLKLATP